MSKKLEVIADPDKATILTRRVFDAPRALVYEAFTKPEHVRRWIGPRSMEMVVCEMDVRVGGKYRWVHRAPDGNEYAFSGEYREVSPPDKVVCTFVFEMFPDAVAVDTLTLVEKDGKTTVTTFSQHKTIEARNAHLAGGMEAGMTEGYARLDEVLADLAKR